MFWSIVICGEIKRKVKREERKVKSNITISEKVLFFYANYANDYLAFR